MCARYTLISEIPVIVEQFGVQEIEVEFRPRYNIAPTQQAPAIVNDGDNRLVQFRWGLIPSWAKDKSIGNKMINARAETLAEKPSFRQAFRKRRCIIPADGFYEWKKEGSGKVPYYIHLNTGKPFGIAGLYETWTSPDGETLSTCTLITTEPNSFMQPLHNRMPVILPPDAYARWLDPANQKTDELRTLLGPGPPGIMAAHAVSKTVNSPANDIPECIEPAAPKLF